MHNNKHKLGKLLVLPLEVPSIAKPKTESQREGTVIDMEVRYLHLERRIAD